MARSFKVIMSVSCHRFSRCFPRNGHFNICAAVLQSLHCFQASVS